MRSLNLFAFLFAGLFVSGCYLTHGLDFAPPVIMTSDAGVMPVGDAGPITVTPDAGMPEPDAFVPPEDAGPPEIELVMNPFFTGWDTGLGAPNMIGYTLGLDAMRRDLDCTRLLVRIDGHDGALVRGSAGTPVATDIVIVDVDTGETLMGPIEIPASVAAGATTTGMMSLAVSDGFRITLGVTRRVGVRVDLARSEDTVGEFTRRDEHGGIYSIWLGMEGSTLLVPSDVRVAGGSPLTAEQIEGNEDAAYSGFHIYPVPTLTVERHFPVEARDIVSVDDAIWIGMDGYRLCSTDGATQVVRLGCEALGERRSYQGFAVFSDGSPSLIGATYTWDGEGNGVTIRLDAPLRIEDGECRNITLTERSSVIEARSTATGTVALSGDEAGVALASGRAYAWGEYGGYLRVAALDSLGHVPVYVPGDGFGTRRRVLRRSQPVITEQATDVNLRNGFEGDLKAFQVAADVTGSIAWLQQSFIVSGFTNPSACLTDFHVARGLRNLADADVTIVDDFGQDLASSGACYRPDSTNHVNIRFTDEHVEDTSGNIYGLRATPTGFAGESLAVSFTRFSSTVPVTGSVANTDHGLRGLLVADSWDIGFGGIEIGTVTRPTFLWSDLSDVPHSDDPSLPSLDWTDEVFVTWYEIPLRVLTIR